MDYVATFLAYAIALLGCWYFSTAWKRSPARRALWKKLDCKAFRYWAMHPTNKLAIAMLTHVELRCDRISGRQM